MGRGIERMRLTEFIDFMNRDDISDCNYSHLEITESMKKARKKYRKSIKKKDS